MSLARTAEWIGIAAGIGIWTASFLAAGPGASESGDAHVRSKRAGVAMDPMFVRDTRSAAGVTGVVVDGTGAPIPGAVVYVYPRSNEPRVESQGYVTDTRGRFAVSDLEPGHYSFVTVHDRATSGEPDVPVFDSSTPVEIVLDNEPIDA